MGNITLTGWGGGGGYNPSTNIVEFEITGKHSVTIRISANHNMTKGNRNIDVGNGALTR